jgi:hypothetical protein
VQNTGFAGNPIDLYMTDAATAGCPSSNYAVVTMAFEPQGTTQIVRPNPNLDFTIVVA